MVPACRAKRVTLSYLEGMTPFMIDSLWFLLNWILIYINYGNMKDSPSEFMKPLWAMLCSLNFFACLLIMVRMVNTSY